MNVNEKQLPQDQMILFVQQWIKIRPISQEDIAHAIGIPQVQLSRFEHLKLKQDVMKQYQHKICNHFKVNPEDVINGKTTLKKGRRPRIRYTEAMKTVLRKFIKDHTNVSIPECEQKQIAHLLGIRLNNVKYFISNHKKKEKTRGNEKLTTKRIKGIKESTLKELTNNLQIKKTDPKLSFKIKEFINSVVPWENKLYIDHV